MLLLPARLTAAEAQDALRLLKQTAQSEAAGEELLVVNAAPLRNFDSAALGVLLELGRLAAESKRGFAVQSIPQKLGALAKLYGVDELLNARDPAPVGKG